MTGLILVILLIGIPCLLKTNYDIQHPEKKKEG